MQRTTLALAALIVGSSFAGAQTPTATSRAEVKAETQKARKAGEIPSGEQGPKEAPFTATQTRAERKAQTKEAIAKGEVTSRGEGSPQEAIAKTSKSDGRTRADVKAEARVANKAGETRAGEAYPTKTK
ncbi:MAG: DUF4148 domain-containing protein [Chitinophagaceae bacterium]|nr:DUF4148 domain-containing protein [Rubrivivax sp.]